MKRIITIMLAFCILPGCMVGTTVQMEKQTHRYILIQHADTVWEYGELKYRVYPGDVLKIEKDKVCRGGVGLCYKVRNVKTGVIGYVRADRMKNIHYIYEE